MKQDLSTVSGNDRLGIWASSVCLFHCLLTPILASIIPIFGVHSLHTGLHLVLLIFIIPIAYKALYSGYRIHRKMAVPLIGLLGCLGLLIAPFLEFAIYRNYTGETVITGLASFLLITAHIINLKTLNSRH